jgi:cysteine desulfurase
MPNPKVAAANHAVEEGCLREFAMTEIRGQKPWVYLDNNATTRTDLRVVEAMLPFLRDQFANPSSLHDLGSAAKDAVRVAREQVCALIGAKRDSEIVFTSGGSESDNTAILSALETQAGRNQIVTSAVEHPAVLALCAHLEKTGRAKVHRIPVDGQGNLILDEYRKALSERTALVSIQWANNETGVVFPVEALASMAHSSGALFHCDAVQAAGRVEINVGETEIDMLSISAHKMHGPKGIGALYVRNGIKLVPLIHGGRQERARRAGTENTPAIVGFGVAAELAAQGLRHDTNRISLLRDYLEREILRLVPSAIRVGDRRNCLPNTLNIAFENIEADSILILLNRESIAASSGSACTSGSLNPSHVLSAMKIPFSHLRGSVRLSLSRESTDCDVDRVIEVFQQAASDLQASSVPTEAAYA